MTYKSCFIFFIVVLLGCDNGFDKSLISDIDKLPSMDGKFTLYRYFVGSPMAFGSGFTVVKIMKSEAECDYTDSDILRFPDSSPFWIKWKDNRTLLVKCLISGSGMAKHQPIKKELIKWKDWNFEVEYYGMYSSGIGQKFSFSDCSVNGEFITFKSKNDSLIFDRNQMQLSIDGRNVSVQEFKMDFFDNRFGLSFTTKELIATDNFDLGKLESEQPFRRVSL